MESCEISARETLMRSLGHETKLARGPEAYILMVAGEVAKLKPENTILMSLVSHLGRAGNFCVDVILKHALLHSSSLFSGGG